MLVLTNTLSVGVDLTDDSDTVSSVGIVNPLIAVDAANGSRNKSLVSVFVKPSVKSKATGSISAGVNENRSRALS